LDYFISRQLLIAKLKSGDGLQVDHEGCYDERQKAVLKFSNRFKEQVSAYEKKGFRITSAKVNYVVYWQKEEKDNDEVRIILPEVRFEKMDNE
jgi:ATP-dependent DNA helicase RecQ